MTGARPLGHNLVIGLIRAGMGLACLLTACGTPRVVRLAGNRIGYVEPITIKPPCLTCHGSSVAPTVAAKIHLLYPQDQAMDFSPDEFRGLFWAEFPLEVHP